MRQIDASKSPRFTQISTFARLPYTRELSDVRATFVGVPFDDATTYRSGARFGPSAVRQASRLLRPYNPFLDVYPFDTLNACDYGDVDVVPGYIEDTLKAVEAEASKIFGFSVPFFCGGDHSVTLPILRAARKKFGRVNLIHLDSHYDFWDSYWGKKYTHGTWLRRAIEEGLVADVVQLGIRGSLYSKEDVGEEKALGVKTFNIRALKNNPEKVGEALRGLKGKTYVSLDIDVVDPAFAPGTGTPEVGGLTSYEAVELIRSLKLELVGFDVVEVSPPYDVSELTAMLAANIIYEAMSVLALKR